MGNKKVESIDKPKVKLLSVAEMERAVKRQIITLDDYKAHLKELGYSTKDIRIKVALIQEDIDSKPVAGDLEDVRNLSSYEGDIIANAEAIRG